MKQRMLKPANVHEALNSG